jgi:hypothetical protein
MEDNPDFDDELVAMRQRAAVEAEFERKRIRRRCMAGKKRKVMEGGWIGHQPWYEVDVIRGRPVLNQERARVVRLIRQLRSVAETKGRRKGYPMSFIKIAGYLNGSNGLFRKDGSGLRGRVFPPPSSRETIKQRRTPKRQVGPWCRETVRKICDRHTERMDDIAKWAQANDRAIGNGEATLGRGVG